VLGVFPPQVVSWLSPPQSPRVPQRRGEGELAQRGRAWGDQPRGRARLRTGGRVQGWGETCLEGMGLQGWLRAGMVGSAGEGSGWHERRGHMGRRKGRVRSGSGAAAQTEGQGVKAEDGSTGSQAGQRWGGGRMAESIAGVCEGQRSPGQGWVGVRVRRGGGQPHAPTPSLRTASGGHRKGKGRRGEESQPRDRSHRRVRPIQGMGRGLARSRHYPEG
jgi:hypothetical protein